MKTTVYKNHFEAVLKTHYESEVWAISQGLINTISDAGQNFNILLNNVLTALRQTEKLASEVEKYLLYDGRYDNGGFQITLEIYFS